MPNHADIQFLNNLLFLTIRTHYFIKKAVLLRVNAAIKLGLTQGGSKKNLNLYALLSLCASAISIVLGLSVYFLNRKSSINRLFMVTMFFNAYWAFCNFGKTIADSSEYSVFLGKSVVVLAFFGTAHASFYTCLY